MAKKLDLKSAMQRAATAPTPKELDPFDRAEEVLSRRPTGYTVATPEPEAPEAPKKESTAPEKATDTAPAEAADPVESKQKVKVELPRPTAQESRKIANAEKAYLPPDHIASRLLGEPRYEVVPLDLIDENPYNARYIYLPEKVTSLAYSMSADGQLVPGIALKRGDRRLLIAGHYRKRAATLGGIPSLRLMVYDDVRHVQDLYTMSFKENDEHTAQTPLDNARAWEKLLKDGIYESEVAIAESIGMSKSNVNKTLSILELESSVMSIVEQNPASYALSVLYELVLLQKTAGSAVAAEMAQRVVENDAGRKEIKQARERHAAAQGIPVRRREKEVARSYRLWNQGLTVGNIKEWDSGKVVIEVAFSDQAKKQQFIDEMRERVQQAAGVAPAADEKGSDVVESDSA